MSGRPRTREFTVAPLAVRTTHPTLNTYQNRESTGLVLHISIENFTGTSITFTVKSVDPTTGREHDVLASAAKSAAGSFTLTVAPMVATEANVAKSAVAPRKWRLATTGTITSVNWSARAEYVNC